MAGSPDVLANVGEQLKRGVVLRVAGVVVLVVVAGTIAGLKLLGHHDANAVNANNAPANVANHNVANHAVANHAVAAAAAPAGNAAVRPAVANTAPAAKPEVRAAAAGANGAPMVTAVQPATATSRTGMAHLDDHLTYQYNALGRRDPFQSLVDGAFVGADVGGEAPPDPGGIKVVGIVWGATDQFALAEDVRGNSFVLRKGDKVQNGVVEGLRRDGVIVSITAEGQTQSVVIPLVRKGDSNAR